jgi:2-dehydro-3-deoxyphosphogluconate aldolase / (4S)-4-hydroxy-2-oxoglutarate aldolase
LRASAPDRTLHAVIRDTRPKAATPRQTVVDALERAGVVAIIRLADASALRRVVDALVDGGVRALEVTMTVPGAVELIRELAPTLPDEVTFGAGTVTDPATVHRVIEAGARFVVSPIFRPAIVAACHEHDVAAIPGCFSPTEIFDAWEAGADVVKVFPSGPLEPSFCREIHGPFPAVKLMPTGGIALDRIADWLRAGAVAVGLGGALVRPADAAAGDFRAITDRARCAVAAVAAVREGS